MRVALFCHKADVMALLGEAKIRIVLTEDQAVLAAAGHHAVRFIRPLRDEVIDERTDVGFVAGKDERRFPLDLERRIDAGHEPLCRGFLIAARAVCLSCGVEARELLHLERRIELERV